MKGRKARSGRRREEELIGGSSLLAGGARPTSASQQALPTSHSIRPPKQNGHQVSRLEEGQLNGISITEAKWPPSVSRAEPAPKSRQQSSRLSQVAFIMATQSAAWKGMRGKEGMCTEVEERGMKIHSSHRSYAPLGREIGALR